MIATIPSQLLYIAAQFASNDSQFKPNIALINITFKNEQITIRSTDGFRAFRCSFPMTSLFVMTQEELNVPAKVFKKRIAKGKYSIIHSDHVKVMNNVDECIVMNPMQPNTTEIYPNVDNIWPDKFNNDPENPVFFNAALLSDFLNEVKRFSENQCTRMVMNKPTNPLEFTADIELYDKEYKVEYLLMPINKRN